MAMLAACSLLSGGVALVGAGFSLHWGNDYARRARKLRSCVQPKNLAELEKEFYTAPFEAAIRGKAYCTQPLLVKEFNREAVIVQTIVKDETYEKRISPPGTPAKDEVWKLEVRPSKKERTHEAPNWSIANGPKEVPIKFGWKAALCSGVMEATPCHPIPPEGRRDEKTEQRVGERCVEVRVQEFMLPTGTTLTALGTIEQEPDHLWFGKHPGAIKKDNSLLVMHPKEFSRKTVAELTTEAEDNAKKWRVMAGVAATLGTGLLVGTAWNIIKKCGQQ